MATRERQLHTSTCLFIRRLYTTYSMDHNFFNKVKTKTSNIAAVTINSSSTINTVLGNTPKLQATLSSQFMYLDFITKKHRQTNRIEWSDRDGTLYAIIK